MTAGRIVSAQAWRRIELERWVLTYKGLPAIREQERRNAMGPLEKLRGESRELGVQLQPLVAPAAHDFYRVKYREIEGRERWQGKDADPMPRALMNAAVRALIASRRERRGARGPAVLSLWRSYRLMCVYPGVSAADVAGWEAVSERRVFTVKSEWKGREGELLAAVTELLG